MRVKTYLFCFMLFITIDTIWINLFIKNFHLHQVRDIFFLKDGNISTRILPIASFYVLFVSLLYYFTVFSTKTLRESIVKGALFGLATYTTITLTNYAAMKPWSLSLVLSDLLWGSFLCMIVAVATKKMVSILYK